MKDSRARLLVLVGRHFPDLDLDRHLCSWHELDDGREALLVDGGSVLFTTVGEDLHVAGPVPGGRVQCHVIAPTGDTRLGAERGDPYSAEQAALN